MDSKNEKHGKLGAQYLLKLDCASISDFQTIVSSLSLDVDTYAISSSASSGTQGRPALLGAQGRRILTIKLEMKKEIDMRRKQFKLTAPAQQAKFSRWELCLGKFGFTDADDEAQQSNEKTKASI